MKGVIKKELLYDLSKTIEILEKKEDKDSEELKSLSSHAINDVAVHKSLDLISITILIYSIYKIFPTLSEQDYQDLLTELKFARKHLQENNLSRYNKSIETLFKIIKRCDAKIKVHLDDVMQAAKIKKSAELLQKGLSIGQAAGLMGLSNWDLQQYVGKTTFLGQHKETMPVKNRLLTALKIFGFIRK